jgi:hypothetical protein
MIRYFICAALVVSVGCDSSSSPQPEWEISYWTGETADCDGLHEVCRQHLNPRPQYNNVELDLVDINHMVLGHPDAELLPGYYDTLDDIVSTLGLTSDWLTLDFDCVDEDLSERESISMDDGVGGRLHITVDRSGQCPSLMPVEYEPLFEFAAQVAYDVRHCMESAYIESYSTCGSFPDPNLVVP